LGAVLVIVVYLLRPFRRTLFWPFWGFVFLAPVLNIVPLPVLMANRYLYLPQIGLWIFFLLIVGGFFKTIRHYKLASFIAFLLVALWSFLLVYQTAVTARLWRNSYLLGTDTIEKTYHDVMAHDNLGRWLMEKGQFNRAGCEFYIAIRLAPGFYSPHIGLADYYLLKGRRKDAIQEYLAALNLNPAMDTIMNKVGIELINDGKFLEGLSYFIRAAGTNPHNLDALNNIVVWYLRAGAIDSARSESMKIIAEFPENPMGYFRLGQSLEAKGDVDNALQTWHLGIAKAHNFPATRQMIEEQILRAERKK
jgi:tetratricopeptide (TPR) repeat protein